MLNKDNAMILIILLFHSDASVSYSPRTADADAGGAVGALLGRGMGGGGSIQRYEQLVATMRHGARRPLVQSLLRVCCLTAREGPDYGTVRYVQPSAGCASIRVQSPADWRYDRQRLHQVSYSCLTWSASTARYRRGHQERFPVQEYR